MTREAPVLAALCAVAFACTAAELPLADDVALEKARAVLARMTLDQKVSLLGGWHTMYLTDIPEAGIARKWAFSDATHGIKPEHSRWDWPHVPGYDNRCTVLPCGSALAMTWNPELSAAHGHVQGEQMRDRGKDQMLGPGVNINRTPLCGRNWEYMSEDPYLNSVMCVPMIRAVQSHGVAATIKHFCVNNQELCRKSVDTVVDERTMHEIYLPAFKAAVREGGVLCLMTSYNKFNGVHTSENSYLLKGLLRDRWGFLGQIVSDWGGHHSTVPAALNGATVEMDRGKGIVYFTDWMHNRFPLADAVRAGRVPEETVNEMALRVVWVMAKVGFLDGLQEKGCRFTERHRQTARAIGEESIVLLKNEKGVLPLAKDGLRRICVLGMQSDMRQCHLGSSAASEPEYEVTPYRGLCDYVAENLGTNVVVELLPLGSEGGKDDLPLAIPNGLLETYQRDGTAAFAERAWEQYTWDPGREWEGEPTHAEFTAYPVGHECKAVRYVARVRIEETGRYRLAVSKGRGSFGSASVFVDDRMVFTGGGSSATCESVELRQGQICTVRVDVSRCSGRKAFVFGWFTPAQIAAAGKDKWKAVEEADAVIAFTGSQLGYGRARESEEHDIPNMLEPDGHDADIARLLKMNLRNLVVVHRSGTQMLMPWADDCPTLLHLSYLGQEAGRPFARVLFGDVNPSGRLVSTWPRRYEDTAVAQAGTYNSTNVIYNERFYVGYRWFDAKGIAPLFPFGYGLGYTTFSYGEAKAVPAADGAWEVSVPVTNTGKVAGREVVQLYVAPVEPKVERVKKELKGFRKTALLKPGETETVKLRVAARDLAYYDVFLHRWHAAAGAYRVLVASSAAESGVKARLAVELDRDTVFSPEEE